MCSDKDVRFPIDALEEHVRAVGPITITVMVSWLTDQFNLGVLDMGEVMGQVGTRLELYEPTDPDFGYVIRPENEPDFSDLMGRDGETKSKPVEKFYAVVQWSPEDIQTKRPAWPLDRCRERLEENEKHIKNQLAEDGFAAIE
nr:hypothetical protein [Chloroflexota bacterium]